MSDLLRYWAIACALASLSHACTDPGCLRNSECQANFRCVEFACVRPSGDAGVVHADTTIPTNPTNPTNPTTTEDAGNE